jgi:hypothetical protein
MPLIRTGFNVIDNRRVIVTIESPSTAATPLKSSDGRCRQRGRAGDVRRGAEGSGSLSNGGTTRWLSATTVNVRYVSRPVDVRVAVDPHHGGSVESAIVTLPVAPASGNSCS